METGWGPVLDNLRVYLAHFADQHATALSAVATFHTTPEAAIAAIRRDLGVEAIGDPTRGRDLTARLERSIDGHFLLRVDAPVPGLLSFFAFGADGESAVHVQGHLFSDDAPGYVEREQPAWQAWLEGIAADIEAARQA